jgi:hypothetical protein
MPTCINTTPEGYVCAQYISNEYHTAYFQLHEDGAILTFRVENPNSRIPEKTMTESIVTLYPGVFYV